MGRIDRRQFIAGSLSAGALAAWPTFGGEAKALPPWKPGELDLHFIYTGVGENTFHIYPDGTTMLLDTGDFFWPDEKKRTPFLPSAERLGGEWVARYLKRVWPKGTIDYLMVSHWHSDHTGDPAQRSRVTADGRKVCGIASVGEDFRFGTFLDHQTPRAGTYTTGNDVETMKFTLDFVERCKAKYGLRHEAFKVGAKDQIRLLHDAAKYRGAFSVRNVCANAVVWDGKDGAEDLGAVSTKGQKRPYINQNTISAALRIDYGKFSFFTGGDISRTLRDAEGKEFSYEELVGRRCGRVTVAKTNHHACGDAMSQGFIDAVGAKVYVNNVWCPSQANADTTPRMVDAGGFVYHTYQPAFFRGYLRKYPWAKGVSREFGHVVVRVAPGGETFRVFVLTAEDESMRILSEREFPSGM